MRTRDCRSCQSAGSVNTWGVCEVCGDTVNALESSTGVWNETPVMDNVTSLPDREDEPISLPHSASGNRQAVSS